MEFKTPYLLILIPIVLGLMWLFHARRSRGAFRFSSVDLVKPMTGSWKVKFGFVPLAMRVMALILICIALAGPRKVLEESTTTTEGIDIVLSLDCSGSMAAEDFTIDGRRMNRFDVVKRVVAEFINQRKNDRMGLVTFAARAYTVCPLTTDRTWLLANLERMKLGMLEDGTAIGSGVASSLTRFKNSKAKSKVIILLTDGVNNAGKLDPLKAAETAQAMGIKLYTIGAGVEGFAPYPVQDVFGRTFYQNVPVQIDEATLQKMAQLTGGRYFRATDTQSLREIYKEIDRLEKTKIEETGYKQYQELFAGFLIAALLLVAAELVLINTVFFKIP